MSETELIERFEDRTLDPRHFDHAEHVRLAWSYLRRYDLFEALDRYRSGLRGFAAHHGSADKYHETITCALLVLIHERMATRHTGPARGQRESWDAFAEANPDLLRWRDGAFFDYYPVEVLASETARRTFVLPHPAGAGR